MCCYCCLGALLPSTATNSWQKNSKIFLSKRENGFCNIYDSFQSGTIVDFLLFPLVEAHSEMGLFTANAILLLLFSFFAWRYYFFSPSLAAQRKQTQRVPADRIRYRDIRTTTTRLLACMSANARSAQHERSGGNILFFDVSVLVCVCDFCLKRMMVRSDSKCLFRAIPPNDLTIENVSVFVIYLMFGSQFRFSTNGNIHRLLLLIRK